MNGKPLWALPLMLPMMLILVMLGAGSPVSAQSSEWTRMTPGANAPGAASLEQQCIRSQRTSGWTSGDCARLRQIAEAGECRPASIPDGQLYAALTGAAGSVSAGVIKQLGGVTPALVCSVAPGKIAHWYTDFDGACNNLGIIPTPQTTFNQSRITGVTDSQVTSSGSFSFQIGGDCCCDPNTYHGGNIVTRIPQTTIRSSTAWSN